MTRINSEVRGMQYHLPTPWPCTETTCKAFAWRLNESPFDSTNGFPAARAAAHASRLGVGRLSMSVNFRTDGFNLLWLLSLSL